jgi:hypothetical protein
VVGENHPDWSNEQTIEHTGTIGVQAGLMTKAKAEIAAMSDDDLKRLSVVRKKELDDVQSEIADIENGQHQPTSFERLLRPARDLAAGGRNDTILRNQARL